MLLGRALASDNLDQFYEAALAVFPDDRYLKYLRDRDKPEELSKMVKGDYALTGLKTKLKSSKIDQKYELGKRQFPNSFDFVTSINQADGINGSRRMLSENFGISADAFCSVFGIRKPNSGSATLADLLEAAKVIYPKDKYLAYLDDLKNPEKVKQMILGQYDLSGLKVKILKRKTHTLELYDLGAKNYPTLQDFIVASKAHHAGIGRFSFLREAVGIGYIDFCRLFLGREPAEEKYYTMAECWEALKQIYTSADDHQMLDEKIVTARILAQKSKAKNSPRNPKNKKPRP